MEEEQDMGLEKVDGKPKKLGLHSLDSGARLDKREGVVEGNTLGKSVQQQCPG